MLLWPDVMNGLHRVHELTSWCFYQKLCAFSELFLWGISHELGNRNSQKTKIILLKITQRDISEHWSYQLCPLGPHLGSDLELRSHLWDLEVISCLEGHSFSHTSWFAHRPCRLLQASHILVAEKPQGTMRESERERERERMSWSGGEIPKHRCLQEQSLECQGRQRGQEAGSECLIHLFMLAPPHTETMLIFTLLAHRDLKD